MKTALRLTRLPPGKAVVLLVCAGSSRAVFSEAATSHPCSCVFQPRSAVRTRKAQQARRIHQAPARPRGFPVQKHTGLAIDALAQCDSCFLFLNGSVAILCLSDHPFFFLYHSKIAVATWCSPCRRCAYSSLFRPPAGAAAAYLVYIDIQTDALVLVARATSRPWMASSATTTVPRS